MHERVRTIASEFPTLAVAGGPPALPEGPPSWPPPDPEVRDALDRAWADGSWGRYHGPHVTLLEERLAATHRVRHAMVCCCGTVAVELALRGLCVRVGDEVILAGYDFAGNFASIEAVGATPVLIDVRPGDFQLDLRHIDEACGPRTRAVVASHLHGGLVDMPRLRELADRRGLAIVEDACQVPGASVQGQPAGTWGDAGVLSFGGSKLLSAGRGGAVLTDRDDVRQRIKIFCQRGNHAFPLSELQAAVLLPQLEVLDERNRLRANRVRRLKQRISQIGALRVFEMGLLQSQSAYYKLGMEYRPELAAGTPREELIAAAQAEGVALDAGFRSFVRRSPRRCRKVGKLQTSCLAGQRTLVLHHPVLLESLDTVDRVADALNKVVTWLQASHEPAE